MPNGEVPEPYDSNAESARKADWDGQPIPREREGQIYRIEGGNGKFCAHLKKGLSTMANRSLESEKRGGGKREDRGEPEYSETLPTRENRRESFP